jgi:hypothetical protein
LCAQVLFSVELTVACLVRKGYFASIYFWIDLAATVSMLLDITTLMDLVFHQSSSLAGSSALDRGPQNKVLARVRQILRVTRIFRLMRLVRLYLQYLVRGPATLSCILLLLSQGRQSRAGGHCAACSCDC